MIDFYAYGNPGCYSKPDNKDGSATTAKQWKDYLDCGFNVMFLGGNNMWQGDGTITKKCFAFAKELGVKKVLIRDERLYAEILGNKVAPVKSLVGENCKFATQSELDDYVKNCLSDYINEEAFIGLSFMDEPNYESANAYGQLYRSVKRAGAKLGKPDIHIQTMIEGKHRVAWRSFAKGGTLDENYAKFFRAYTDGIGKLDFLGTDLYPFKLDNDGETPRFMDGYFNALKIFVDYCKNTDTEFGFVLQSYELVGNYYPLATHRLYSLNEMMLQINVALGLRAGTIMFYTYEDFGSMEDTGYRSYGEGSMISADGRKTEYYRWTQLGIVYAKKAEEFLNGYKYAGCRLFVSPKAENLRETLYAYGFKDDEMKEIVSVDCDRHVLFVTEMKKDENTAFMILNAYDDALCNELYEASEVNVCFDKEVGQIEVYRNGVTKRLKIEDGSYRDRLIPGEAIFVKIVKR